MDTTNITSTVKGIIPLYMVTSVVNQLALMDFEIPTLLTHTSVSSDQLNVDRSCSQIVPFADLIQVFHNARQHSNIADLGLQLGRSYNLGIYGALGYAMMCSSTDIEAVNLALKFHKIILGSHIGISMTIEQDHGVTRISDSLPKGPTRILYIEQFLSGFFGFNNSLLGTDNQLFEIRFDYADPGYRQQYEQAFGCKVVFDAPFNEIVFDTLVLGVKLPNADSTTALACEAICEKLLHAINNEKVFTSKVKHLMLTHWDQQPSMETIAQWLSIDVRTLRRKLLQEESSYRQIKHSACKEIALDYLKKSDLNIQQIAALTGYNDTGSFRKAFHKWTGNYPSHYRS
ncbi:AraC family transcriptional regulator [Oceanicoccus sp. KOV_DT_Chl]|uniref:AraC family transcriptional regulator n=1 Tax=Oceanicoccus sp. KOV_DT_Chl TaxID=1904639 RepID=UPI00135AFB77|nr:AraC family transcriptional regulator [Oceanicoccus sp. KOV_DT_Chl]